MPLYQVLTQDGSLDDAQRAQIALGLTDIHLDLAGGLRQFINVVFQHYPVGCGFNAGVIGAPMVIGGSIRAGREQAVKTAMMEAISALVISVSNVSPKDLTVSIADVKASNVMEGGHLLPEPGEEAAWLAKVGPLLGLRA
jgi:phenylpyruvate tautomerase PptA (4-oxalocrotonate tautomerase family)